MALAIGERTVYYLNCDKCPELIGAQDTIDDLISTAEDEGWYVRPYQISEDGRCDEIEYYALCPDCAREAGKVK